jgi:Asp-tRNA(Asn)/Glu-tRNA(Gln) amidotransferase A subunit family amidase
MKLTRFPGPVSVASLAALLVSSGFGAGGLPIGLQLIGRYEETLLRCGAAGESIAPSAVTSMTAAELGG